MFRFARQPLREILVQGSLMACLFLASQAGLAAESHRELHVGARVLTNCRMVTGAPADGARVRCTGDVALQASAGDAGHGAGGGVTLTRHVAHANAALNQGVSTTLVAHIDAASLEPGSGARTVSVLF